MWTKWAEVFNTLINVKFWADQAAMGKNKNGIQKTKPPDQP